MIFLLSLLFAMESSQVPQEAIDTLNQIPGKKLSINLILGKAMQSSETFKQVLATKISADVPYLAAESAYDWNLTLNYGLTKNEFEQVSSTSPSNIEGSSYSLGLNKYFQTGTAVGLELDHGDQLFTISGTSIPKYYESQWNFSLSQSLWKDSFGYSSRKNLLAAELETKANEDLFEKNLQDWSQRVSEAFYLAWMNQAQVNAARESLALKARLLNVSKKKLKRGTTEKPDFLQIESSYLEARIRKKKAEQDLQKVWQNLVIFAKLPEAWAKIDASLIPISLDSPFIQAKQMCKSPTKSKNHELAALIKKAESARLKLDAAKNSIWPDLKLSGSISANAIDSESSTSISDATAMDNQQWSLGVTLTYPLGNYKSKSDIKMAYSQNLMANAKMREVEEDIKVNWISLCNDFFVAQENYEMIKNIRNKQKARSKLEEERFKIGRSNVLQVVQAGDDSATSDISLNKAEVDRRLLAWKIISLNGSVREYLKHLGVGKSESSY